MKSYKRLTREMPQYVRDKIASSMRGRKLSPETKQKISDGQKAAWAKIPQKQTPNTLWGTSEENNSTKNNK